MKTPSWLSACSSKLSISVASDTVLNNIPPHKHSNTYSSSSEYSSSSNSQDSGAGTPSSLPSNLSIATHPSIPSLQKLTPESLNLTVSTFPATSLKPNGGSGAEINFLKVHEGMLYAVSGIQVAVYNVNSDLDLLETFSAGEGAAAIKSLGFCSGKIFTAHQDCKIRAWEYSQKVKRRRFVATLPTVKDRLKNFMLPKSYVKVRRHRSKLWVEHYDAVSSLATSDNPHLLHSVSWDRHLKIWKGSNFRCTESIKAHDDAINAVVVSNDAVIYTGSADSKIRVWGKNSGEKKNTLIATLERHKSAVNALALTSDGSVLFSGSCDRSILVWEREDSANYMTVAGALRGHSKAVLCLISVDEFLFSGSADRTVRIWSRGSGGRYCLTVLDGHEKPVRAVAAVVMAEEEVHGGGEIKVFSGSLDGEIKVWKVAVSSELETTSSSSSYASD